MNIDASYLNSFKDDSIVYVQGQPFPLEKT